MTVLFRFRCGTSKIYLILFAAAVSLAAPAGATVITAPIASTASDFSFHPSFPITRVFDQSGLSATYTSGVTDFDSFTATHGADSSGDAFASPATFPGNIDFDLGAAYTIEKFALWNDSQDAPSPRGINEFTLFTDDNSAFSSPTNVGTFNAAGFEVGSSVKQTFDVTDSVGRFVRLRIISDHGDGNLQFGEIAFGTSEVTAVPEPSTLALLAVGGLAMLGYGWRQRVQ